MHRWRGVMQLFESLNKLARRNVWKVRKRLTDLHRRAAQVAHRVENSHRRSPMRFRQQPLGFISPFEPTAQPIEGIRRRNLGLERAQHAHSSKPPDRHRAKRPRFHERTQWRRRLNIWPIFNWFRQGRDKLSNGGHDYLSFLELFLAARTADPASSSFVSQPTNIDSDSSKSANESSCRGDESFAQNTRTPV